jgi:dihydrofolate synthase/folylpolyglutamate synthase
LQTDEAGFERALARVRPAAEAVGATQFETLTAAAFADFEARGVEAAVIEAGLGGRLDATNVIDARVVLLTNVALEHTEVLGETRELIAAEKLAVARPGAIVVLPDEEFSSLVPGTEVRVGGAREAAEAFLGRPVELAEAALPGRLEIRDGEVRDGAHTPDAVDWLLERLPEPHDYVVVASILGDKDADGILERLGRAGSTLVATTSSNDRALPAREVAARGRMWFGVVETVDDPRQALALARTLGPRVLVTGSLYLLADLYLLAETGRDE